MTSLTITPPSLANRAAAVGQSSEIDPTLGSLSLVGTLQPPRPILRAFCPSIRGPLWGQAQLENLACWQLLGHPANWAFKTHSETSPFSQPTEDRAQAAGVNAIQKEPESCVSQGLGSPQHTTAQAGSRFPLPHPAPPWKPLDGGGGGGGEDLFSSVDDSGTPRLSPLNHQALPDSLLQSTLFTLPCRGGLSSAESAAGVQHSLPNPQPHSEHPAKRAKREPDPPPKRKPSPL